MRLLKHLKGDWKSFLQAEFEKPYFATLQEFLLLRVSQGAEIYPPVDNTFAALNSTPLANIKAVILGQDPYHGSGQAHGLAFSVMPGQSLPPSLRNIFRELEDDLGCVAPMSGGLQKWASQGVLLLNTVLTVEKSQPGTHRNKGWESFTDFVIEVVSQQCPPTVFLLWGSHAQQKAKLIDGSRHCILQAPHPSPLSAYRGYLGCRHFSKCNDFLSSQGRDPVDWNLG